MEVDEVDANAINERVVEVLNDAQTKAQSSQDKLNCLRQAQELILHQKASLLDNFLDEMLAFQTDENAEIRKFVVGFMEGACRIDSEVISKIMSNLLFILQSDTNVNVIKRLISVCGHIYLLALASISKMRNISANVEITWESFAQLKGRIYPMVENENEGIRTHAIKFIETTIIAQSCKVALSEGCKEDLFTLDQLPRDHRLISFRKLEAESKGNVQKLLDLMSSSHISSVNLMICMNSLVQIARQRPEFMEKVVLGLEALHVNLPPTLAKSQVQSVRKALKMHFLTLLRHPSSAPCHPQITTLLSDLGATQAQVLKALPAGSELRKRMRKGGNGEDDAAKKRARQEEDEDEEEVATTSTEASAIDVTAQFISSKLDPNMVSDLVLLFMIRLPDDMPAHFQSSFTPIAAAGTEAQIRHLSRLMSTQLTQAGLGPGLDTQKQDAERKLQEMLRINQIREGAVQVPPTPQINSGTAASSGAKAKQNFPMYGVQNTKSSKRLHQLGLVHITRPLEPEQLIKMRNLAFERIMAAEKRALQGGALSAQQKLLVRMSVRFDIPQLQELLQDYILSDQKNRSDLAINWIYELYAKCQGFTSGFVDDCDAAMQKYDKGLCGILDSIMSRGEHKETLFHKILTEAPWITKNALHILKQACMDKVYGNFGMSTLREMIITRSKQRDELLEGLVDFCSFERMDIRTACLDFAKQLYEMNIHMKNGIKLQVNKYLYFLLDPTPPQILFGKERGRNDVRWKWDESTMKACLYLYLHLLPADVFLIHHLAIVYVSTTSDVKRVILRLLEAPVKAIGMHCTDLLDLVEHCPEGAETLVTRIVHLLTERNPPTLDLVNRVRDLYSERVPDVRCLIPILTGLKKSEIVGALPKLIKLNPNVVKEVFNRLLFGKSLGQPNQAPMTPSELLTTLHTLPAKTPDQVKSVISAMSLLLNMRNVYTREILAGVIQNLLDMHPLPVLIMRTTIHALNTYHALLGFVMNVLAKLVIKEVWKDKRVWEGFIKCCEKSQPHSFQVLLTLPPEQLSNVFDASPDTRQLLIEHISNLSSHQQSQVPQKTMKVLQQNESESEGESLERETEQEKIEENVLEENVSEMHINENESSAEDGL